MKFLYTLTFTLLCFVLNFQASANGGCTLLGVDVQVGSCDDGDPDVVMFFSLAGDCIVDQICFIEEGIAIGCADVLDLELGDGEGVNFGALAADTFYEFSVILNDGTEYSGYSVDNGNCEETICDCAGTEHTIGVLSWLGDTFADNGGTEFLWEEQAVDFDCETWGYDCGDIEGAPAADPFQVCLGNLPPNNGCAVEECFPTSLAFNQGSCADNDGDGVATPVIEMTFGIDGTCLVDELCFSEDGGLNYNCINLPELDQIVFNGDGLNLINTIPDVNYLIYFVTGGNTSQVYTFLNGNCNDVIEGCTNEFAVNYNPNADVEDFSCIYDDTICDCNGTELTIGVLAWLGDTFEDIGGTEFLWDGEAVSFNCSDWGYDCGDIDGAPEVDPFNVCSGGLPPNNGCEAVSNCTAEISAINTVCSGIDTEVSIDIETTGIGNCSYDELCYSINGGAVICEDISWATWSLGLQLSAQATNATVEYYLTTADGHVSDTFTHFILDCNNTEECLPLGMSFTQEPCADNNQDGVITPTIGITFEIEGPCLVEDLCFSTDGIDYTCLALQEFELFSGNGQGINLINTEPDTEYSIYFTTADGVSSIFNFSNGNCNAVIPGCTNEHATNYNPNADLEDGTCVYDETICDCAGTEHTIGVLSWLGDSFDDVGGTEFFWAGFPVDFNCATWGYDCGDIDGAPSDDPFNVCSGGLPPSNGCLEDAACIPFDITLEEDCFYDEENQVWVPRVLVTTFFPGDCIVTSVCEVSSGNPETCYLLPEADIFLNSGEGVFIPVEGNSVYTITAITEDGEISENIFIGDCLDATFGCTNPFATNYDPEADEEDGSCIYNETICDCNETEHTIGVLTWLGDGFADNGEFTWEGAEVSFNCEVWGFDCGDIETDSPSDPFNVCSGGLPPNNGCGIDEIFGCTDDMALNYNPQATVDDGTCEFEESVFGCTDPEASNYNPLANVDNGTCEYLVFGCTNPQATNYNPLANVDNGTCVFGDIMGCTDPNANNYNSFANVDDGSCTYGCVLPTILISVVCEEENPDGFYLDLQVTSVGSGAPYNVANNNNDQSLILTDEGSYVFGPFENFSDVVITANSLETENCLYISDIYSTFCSDEPILGCTDVEATNYNPEATQDDGSCIYGCEYPILLYSTVCEDGEENGFYIEIEVSDLGNGAPYNITNNVNDETFSLNFMGTISLGPYSNDEQVLYNISSENLEACFLTSPVLSDNCEAEEDPEGCTDELATNYDADALIDDGSCQYDFVICDCDGNEHSPTTLSQLGDGNADAGSLNFNCEMWGYDCGDIAGAPDLDPNNVCNGELPPLNGCVSSVNELIDSKLAVYPNPTEGLLTVTLSGTAEKTQISLYNLLGELIYSELMTTESIVLDLNELHLNSGVYIINASTKKSSENIRVQYLK